jgi:hypothetical protein
LLCLATRHSPCPETGHRRPLPGKRRFRQPSEGLCS